MPLMAVSYTHLGLFAGSSGLARSGLGRLIYGADLRSWRDFAPVSYTHLDVYKRQPVNGGRNYSGPKVAKFLVG